MMYNKIGKHGKNLNTIFNTDYDNITLCKKLFRLEKKAHKLSTDYCNGILNCNEWEIETDKILLKVYQILNANTSFGLLHNIKIFVNADCRGYALKICDKDIKNKIQNTLKLNIYCDWGGYGIIAPDFN